MPTAHALHTLRAGLLQPAACSLHPTETLTLIPPSPYRHRPHLAHLAPPAPHPRQVDGSVFDQAKTFTFELGAGVPEYSECGSVVHVQV